MFRNQHTIMFLLFLFTKSQFSVSSNRDYNIVAIFDVIKMRR